MNTFLKICSGLWMVPNQVYNNALEKPKHYIAKHYLLDLKKVVNKQALATNKQLITITITTLHDYNTLYKFG